MLPNKCSCGAEPVVVKLFESKRYDCFVKCEACGLESKVYSGKQGAINGWNRTIEKLSQNKKDPLGQS